MPLYKEFDGARVIVDDRYPPVLITIWSGRATVPAARWSMEQTNALSKAFIDRYGAVVSISDATAAQRPAPDVRKFWADNMSAMPEIARGTLGTFIVTTNPMMRGVLTAIGWLNEQARAMTHTATMGEALAKSLAALEQFGIAQPTGLQVDEYAPPANAEPS